jgi:Txe/YoeB family toxin of toxin-antitoxin system
MYKVILVKQAQKDVKKIEQVGLKNKVDDLIEIIRKNPFQNPPPYKKLLGKENRFSRRINIQHRLVYEIDGETIKILQMWSHYDYLFSFYNFS